MASVNFDNTVGGDGSTVTDDSSPVTGLAEGGHTTRFVPALAQVVAVAQWVKNRALDVLAWKNTAADAAASANNAAGNAGNYATAAYNSAQTATAAATQAVASAQSIAGGPVASINGKTGVVSLVASDVPEAALANLASAATTNIGGVAASTINITGANAITSFGVAADGVVRCLEFAGSLTLTNSAALDLPGAANITTQAGDVAKFRSLGGGSWKCTAYQKKSGQPVVAVQAFIPGDVLYSNRALATPDWLPCDGSIYLQASYPALFSALGLLPNNLGNWSQATLPALTNWCSVAYGNGVFVAISGTAGTNTSIAATSTDGITWTQRVLPASTCWSSITFGNGVFVAVAGAQGYSTNIAATSADGINWTQRALPNGNWSSVTYGNGTFVAVCCNNTSVAATSADGIAWTQRALPNNDQWWSVTYGNGLFVAVSQSSSNYATSPDGIAWTQRTLPFSGSYSITYGNGLFVAVRGGSTAYAITSGDGIKWASSILPEAGNWYAITYGNGVFVAVGGTNLAATSPDGVTWTKRFLPNSSYWSCVCAGNGLFAALSGGAGGSSSVAALLNPITYSQATQFATPNLAVPLGSNSSKTKAYVKS